jgi:hypothetical protein
MNKSRFLTQALTPFCLFTTLLYSTSAYTEEVQKIEDNSFLIEEAYNQEEGVIQYIQAFQYSHKTKEWFYTFTQEIPFPNQTHQVSYTIPIAHVKDDKSETGLGDVGLNYRYQLVANDTVAFAPRFSLILPSGDYKKGLGNGATGYQINLPLSVVLSEKLISHWNAGATYTPNGKEASGAKADLNAYSYGASLIYLQTETFNWMIEYVRNNAQAVESDGSKVWDDAAFVNPGFRFAKNYASGWQMVSGLSFPIGVGPSRKDNGVLLYLSFEK